MAFDICFIKTSLKLYATGFFILVLGITARAQCWQSVPVKTRQEKLYNFLAGYWNNKPDTLATKVFKIEKPGYLLRIAARDESPVYDTIENRLNELILCDSKKAEAYFARRQSAVHLRILNRLRVETNGEDRIDSLYYRYPVGTMEEFAQKVSVLSDENVLVLDSLSLEEVYRFRKDWVLNFGPDYVQKSPYSKEDKEKMAEYLCRLGQCQYQEELLDQTTPNFR